MTISATGTWRVSDPPFLLMYAEVNEQGTMLP